MNGFSTPSENWTQNTGVYLEDSWSLKRLTLQGALRFDYATSGNPEILYGPGKYLRPHPDRAAGTDQRLGLP